MALKFEYWGFLRVANNLMKCEYYYRPTGPLITAKLDEYKKNYLINSLNLYL